MKRTNYFVLTILCFLAIIAIQLIFSPAPTLRSKTGNFGIQNTKTIEQLDGNQLINSPKSGLLLMIILAYLFIFVCGLGILVYFIIKKIDKKPILEFQEPEKPFPLSREQTIQTIFGVSLILLIILIIQITGYYFFSGKNPKNMVTLAVFLNLALETGAAILILETFPKHWLGFKLKLNHIKAILLLYAALIPVLLAALLINSSLLKAIGIKSDINLAVKIFLWLKDPGSTFILAIQVMILGPLAEELIFRGLIYKFLRQKLPFIFSAVASSLLFSMLHKTPQDTLALFIIGIALCYIYEKTQNIISPILLHSIFNSINLAMLLVLKNTIS